MIGSHRSVSVLSRVGHVEEAILVLMTLIDGVHEGVGFECVLAVHEEPDGLVLGEFEALA